MPVARTVSDVIAGEAVSGTQEERWNDMLNIASVIVNRANMLGIPVESVIANSNEFNSYGKPLPSGASDYTDMAKQAVDFVQQNGPVNNATFYATPNAVDSLPSGLQPEISTSGHQFFSDPKMRSINTAEGFKVPEPQSSLMRSLSNELDMSQVPGQKAISGILGDGAFNMLSPVSLNPQTQVASPVDTGEFSPMPYADINPQPTGVNRPFPADPSVTDKIQAAVTSVLGPDAKAQVTSGQEGPLGQYGSNRHKTGLAEDVSITDATGHVLSWTNPNDLQKMKDIAQSAATQQANIGLGYNDPNMMHIDYVDPKNFTPGQDQSWGLIGNQPEFAAQLQEARQNSLMPASFYEAANQRVIDNNVVPTINNPNGYTQAQETGGILSAINPVSVSPIERTALPDISQSQPTENFSGGLADRIVGAQKGIYSPEQTVMDQNVERQLADMQAARGILSDTPTSPLGIGNLAQGVLDASNASQANSMAMPNYNQAFSSNIPAMSRPLDISSAFDTSTGLIAPADDQAKIAQQNSALRAMPSFAELSAANAIQQPPDPLQAAISSPYSANGLLNSVTSAMPSPAIATTTTTMPGQQPDAAFGANGLLTGNPQNTGMLASNMAPVSSPIAGPVNTPAVTQQKNIAATKQAIAGSFPAAPTKGLLGGMINKPTLAGGILGATVGGPIGGLLGALAGNYMAGNQFGGLSGIPGLSNYAPGTNQIAGGAVNIGGIYGGQYNPGTYAVANNGTTITAQPGGWTTTTNPYGVTESVSPTGHYASYFGPSVTPNSTVTHDPSQDNGGYGSPGLF